MELTFVLVVAVLSVITVAALSERLGLAAPLSLVIVGIGLSFVPGMPHLEVDPEWILAGVLPPLLYSAAVNMPVVDLRRNLAPIASLAVVLVVVTTLCTGALFHWLLPGIGWPAAFALGAVISPTDAVAASAVGKRLGLPHRLLTVLEGEGLVNDASALVLLRSAVAAFAGAVSLWSVAGRFLYAVALAVAIGLVVAAVSVRVRALLKDPVLNTAISFAMPFVAFLPAEAVDASGVLAVVVAGVAIGHQSPKYIQARDRLAETINWRTLSFLLESGLFLLMGLSVKTLVDQVGDSSPGIGRAVAVGLLAALCSVVVRMVYIVPLIAAGRRKQRRAADMKPHVEEIRDKLRAGEVPERASRPVLGNRDAQGPGNERRMERFENRVTRALAHVDFLLHETFGWRGGVVLAWSGMRGAVTVAAAQTLPSDTPFRPQLILVAFVVATATLLVQGLSLPWVIRAMKVPGDDPERLLADYRDLFGELADAAGGVLDDPALAAGDGAPYDPRVVEHVRANNRMLARTDDRTRTREAAKDPDLRIQYLRLTLRVLEAENDRLLKVRASGRYSSVALHRAQSMIDVEAAQLQQFEG